MKVNADKILATDAGELANKLREGSENMFRLRFQMSMGQTDGVKKYRLLRRERARILTIQKERGDQPLVAAAKPGKTARAKKAPKATR